jgi:integrase
VFSDDVQSEEVRPAACGSIASAIDSAARNGESVARRRYQRGSVYQNKAKTVWLGNYTEYVLDSGGEEKRVRRDWATVRLIWEAAIAQACVDRVLPKPRLPRVSRKVSKCLRLEDVAKIIAHSHGEQRVFYWLAAETGLRAGEIAGLRLGDVEPDRISLSQSVWMAGFKLPNQTMP